MWQFIAFFLTPIPLVGSQELKVDSTVFGPSQRLICEWFTNFENSRFEKCRAPEGRAIRLEDGASIGCSERVCAQLDAQARKVARWKKPEPVWGTFSVEFYGRISTKQHKKRYLGDATRNVMIERIVSVRPKNIVR